MALGTATPEKTAWGDLHAYIGTPGTGEILATSFDDLGVIDGDGITLETADGTVYSLKDVNGNLIDELSLEPELTVKVPILKPSETVRGKFWDVEETGTGASRTLDVKSLINNDKKSFKFDNPKAIGSESFLVPTAKIKMSLQYSAQKGFFGTATFKIVKGASGVLFSFGIVPTPTEG